jgi:hypothetical protein
MPRENHRDVDPGLSVDEVDKINGRVTARFGWMGSKSPKTKEPRPKTARTTTKILVRSLHFASLNMIQNEKKHVEFKS